MVKDICGASSALVWLGHSRRRCNSRALGKGFMRFTLRKAMMLGNRLYVPNSDKGIVGCECVECWLPLDLAPNICFQQYFFSVILRTVSSLSVLQLSLLICNRLALHREFISFLSSLLPLSHSLFAFPQLSYVSFLSVLSCHLSFLSVAFNGIFRSSV
jgi:hypothetical protein